MFAAAIVKLSVCPGQPKLGDTLVMNGGAATAVRSETIAASRRVASTTLAAVTTTAWSRETVAGAV